MLAQAFTYVPSLSLQAAKALTRLHTCAVLSETSLLAYALHTKVTRKSWFIYMFGFTDIVTLYINLERLSPIDFHTICNILCLDQINYWYYKSNCAEKRESRSYLTRVRMTLISLQSNDVNMFTFPWWHNVSINIGHHLFKVRLIREAGQRGYTTFSMLNSAEHEIYPAHKC